MNASRKAHRDRVMARVRERRAFLAAKRPASARSAPKLTLVASLAGLLRVRSRIVQEALSRLRGLRWSA